MSDFAYIISNVGAHLQYLYGRGRYCGSADRTVSRLNAKSGVVELLAAAGAVMRFQIWLPTITLGQNTGISERILFKSIFITTREICLYIKYAKKYIHF
jgi:hypothetical protein